MSESGHGNTWSPINGNAPWWVNMVVWVLRQGFLFQIATVILLGLIVAVVIGRVDSPMLAAFKEIAHRTGETAGRTHEMSLRMEEQIEILKELRDVSRENRNISANIRQNTEPPEALTKPRR